MAVTFGECVKAVTGFIVLFAEQFVEGEEIGAGDVPVGELQVEAEVVGCADGFGRFMVSGFL